MNLVSVILNNGICSGKNRLRRPIILLKPEDFTLGIITLKIQNIPDVSTTESVDTLRVVADDTDIFKAFRKEINQHVLRPVRVLVLIDKKVLEAVLIFFENVLIVLEKFDGL